MNETPTRERKMRRHAAVGFFAFAVLLGALDSLLFRFPEREWPLTVASAVLIAASTLAWCIFDARIIGYAFARGQKAFIVLIPIVAFPAYLVRSRGWTSSWKVALGLPAFVAWEAVYVGVGHVVGAIGLYV